ncbi:hypothetical protein H257_02159 [Aphanomyces astaci]|uniref:Uncharacterized protein n=1 Tax=Aphanomyces astaci TaxID=112090 RepID=W4H7B9_APHAT|nr:hypothetical protein H257_02159 [Aphanomyces astaci]ETV87184.1 hypothetical protein H257_02159 [Aphanomyces astaci]|eukprot:XP_009823983.1 hypothetical protein H257_02159 [Aphanomyces astaci]
MNEDDSLASSTEELRDATSPESVESNQPHERQGKGTRREANTRPARSTNSKFGQVQPRYLDINRSTTYVRNRTEQLQRRRDLERANSARANERMQQCRALTELKHTQEQIYRQWLQASNADAHRLRNASNSTAFQTKAISTKANASFTVTA